MWMTAIKEHGYNGRRIKPGQDYQVFSRNDMIVLQTAGLSRPKRILTTKTAKSLVVAPVIEEKITEITIPDVAEETREEVPETSPPEGRKRRRQYKRKDMVPEE